MTSIPTTIRFVRRERKVLTKADFNHDQNFCVDCNRAINKNCNKSEITQGKCGSCYRTNVRDHVKRKGQKNRTNNRNNQRKYKYASQQY